ncbi:UPF0488 protein CG14286 [Anoplophora glabripennis]|uniref:UPF0488 protein CG14286 n=1 Tax=Anoplophora glabripennis TaxID=217634 RepID=UPI0008737106|nr:UPF0488 protein CG14286 [Anoplophora glabripennis]
MSPKYKKCGKNVEDSQKMKVKETINASVSVAPKLELEHQFEMELCWCIHQIQIALKSGKLNNKQEQDHIKALNTLMSNSAPLVKKRQIMRLSFGDYRMKMAAEEKKYSRNAVNIRVKQSVPSKKSVFVKKSSFPSSRNKFVFISDPSNDNESEELSNGVQNIKIEPSGDTKQNKKDFNFVPSDNSFRFSFGISEES